MNPDKIDSAFPFDSYRTHQRDILHKSASALFGQSDTDVVVIDAPTGIGKSGINIALGKLSEDAFYTTPQKQLRDQLADDDALSPHHTVLKGRRDYKCDIRGSQRSNLSCHNCPVNTSPNETCIDEQCIYWNTKDEAMHADVATVTFSYLIYDNYIPPYVNRGSDSGQSSITDFSPENNNLCQISFEDRRLLIIDEAHTLEGQVASLHAGFTLSATQLTTKPADDYLPSDRTVSHPVGKALDLPDRPPENLYTYFTDRLDDLSQLHIKEVTDLTVPELTPLLEDLRTKAAAKRLWLSLAARQVDEESKARITINNIQQTLEGIERNIKILMDQRDGETPWVVDADSYNHDGDTRYKLGFKPVYVGPYLQSHIWNRADKIVLSTATMPFRETPEKWLNRIGLDPRQHSFTTISKPMPFHAANRPVITDSTVGSLSGDGKQHHCDDVVSQLRVLSERHGDEKGLVHTVSYQWAERLHAHLNDIAMLHRSEDDRDAATIISQWQRSAKPMLLSPAMMEGVDLEGDRCRWQALAKVPYGNLGDSRVSHLVYRENDRQWYNETTAQQIIQSAGRAVRSADDEAVYYVLDDDFSDVMTSSRTPDWFGEAVV